MLQEDTLQLLSQSTPTKTDSRAGVSVVDNGAQSGLHLLFCADFITTRSNFALGWFGRAALRIDFFALDNHGANCNHCANSNQMNNSIRVNSLSPVIGMTSAITHISQMVAYSHQEINFLELITQKLLFGSKYR